jgi:hypothetical protein
MWATKVLIRLLKLNIMSKPPNRLLRKKWEERETLNHHLRILAAKPLLGTRTNRNFLMNKTASKMKELGKERSL